MEKTNLKLLMIEDSPLEVELIRDKLSKEHESSFEIGAVTSLQAGFERLAKEGVDVVLLDLHLPDGRGLQNIVKVHDQAPAVPIVVLTGTFDAALGVEALRSGAQDYLLKGETDGKLLCRVLRYAIERKRGEEALRKAHDELEIKVQGRTAELVKSNQALKQTQQQLVQQERLRALGEMASGIAHDFNNALSPILGYSEMMLDGPNILQDKSMTIEYLKVINTAAKDAARVVSHLREFYRPREKNETFKSLDVNRLVEQAVTLTQPKWKAQSQAKGIDIRMEPQLGKVPEIEGNEAELREVLTNLIFNAVDAMPKGGTINFRTFLERGCVTLEVKDTGTGMNEEIRRRCLEPFFTTKSHGTGLGLSMVYGIVQRHGGTIAIESEAGKGTAFSISLPFNKAGKKSEEIDNRTPETIRPLRILYVEDEPAVQKVILQYLERDGHTVTVASDGLDGLNKFHAGRFDLVITDKAMARMSGEHLAIKIKELIPAKPVILLSGTGELMNAAGEPPKGIDIVVGKPVTLEDLRRAIARLFP